MTDDPGPGLTGELAAYHDAMTSRIGETHRRHLGVVDALLIRRYATAIGEASAIHHDRVAAISAGYTDIVAPPNLLSGIMEWGAGHPENELRPDGTYRPGPTSALRVMGAGEEMELLRPVTAGTELWLEDEVEEVSVKQGRSGALVFVTARHDFVGADGAPYNRNRRTVMARL